MDFQIQSDGRIGLGTEAEILLRLIVDLTARQVQRTTGMHHFAILYPSLKERARAIAWLFALRYANARAGHGVSKTAYLDDPEANNIELYVRTLDVARFEILDGQVIVCCADGRIDDGCDRLDVEALFRSLECLRLRKNYFML